MINYLHISFYFPPLAGPSSRHNLSWVRALHEHGLQPTVLAAPEDVEYPKDQALKRMIPTDINVKRFRWPYRHNKYLNLITEITRTHSYPLTFKGSRHIYRAAMKELASTDHRFIYSVSGIAADHLAAMAVKRDTGLPWVAEFRDPWIHNAITWQYMEANTNPLWYRYQREKIGRLLKEVLRSADLIVVESPMHGELLVRDFDADQNKIVPYGVGYGEEYFTGDEVCQFNFPTKPVLGFLGSTYNGYEDSIRTYVETLKTLEDKGYEFTFVSVGKPVTANESLFTYFAEKLGLRQYTPIDRVDLPTALNIMKSMDFGTVITADNHPSHINSKLWEYLKTGLSVLSIAPENGAMAKVIGDSECGYMLPYDKNGMTAVLEQALNDYKAGNVKKASPEFADQYSSSQICAKLAKKIQELL